MIVGALTLELFLPESGSLKDKRQIVKSITARLTNEFGVAAAEVDQLDKWQIAVIGVACVSNSANHATRVLENVVSYVERTRPDVEISNQQIQMLAD